MWFIGQKTESGDPDCRLADPEWGITKIEREEKTRKLQNDESYTFDKLPVMKSSAIYQRNN